MNSNKFKFLIFLILLIILFFIILYSIFGFSFSFLSRQQIKENRKFNKNLINELKINNIDATYDKNNNIYYYNIEDKYENKNYILKLELESGYKYKLLGFDLNIIKVDYNKPIDVLIYNKNYYYQTKIQLTNLPIISITTNEKITDLDTISTFKYINSKNIDKVYSYNSKIHVRGATTRWYGKKSYKLDVYNKEYTKEKKINIPNFYYGSSFILDAVYRDPSKIRNVLAIEIWNDISNDFNNVKMYSEFVELFINNEYVGLYVLTEPVNRTKLNLNKSKNNSTSFVIKSNDWSIVKDVDSKLFYSDYYDKMYELKYPNDEEYFYDVWNNFFNKISNFYNNDIKNTYDVIINTWNIKNYIDLVIFNDFIFNSDNKLIKNNYFYSNNLNSEFYLQPWDMEFSFGLFYSNSSLYNRKKDYTKNDIILFYHPYSNEINKLLIERYYELRKNILTEEYFDNKLDYYINLLSKGSANRDSKLWYEYDVVTEIEEIRTWLYDRLDYFDKFVKEIENEL